MEKLDKQNGSAVKAISRTIHVVLTLVILAVLMGTHTDLRSNIDSGNYSHPALFTMATLMSIVLYFIVSIMDPGYVKRSDPDVREISLVLDDSDEEVELFEVKSTKHRNEHDNSNFSSEDGETSSMLPHDDENSNQSSSAKRFNLEPHQRCGFCGLERPLRARHCKDCKHCVRKFDHHCPWIANCVGERNHRWFWTFLTYEVLLIGWSIYISTTGYISTESSKEWINKNILLLLVDIVLAIFLFVVGSLCSIHTYMVLSNHTTWESMSRHRITYLQKIDVDNPFNLGCCRNIYVFFCHCKPYNWLNIYEKKVGSTEIAQNDNAAELNDVRYRDEDTLTTNTNHM